MNIEKSVNQNAPKCFVIMPFTAPPQYPKDHFDVIYRDIFMPAIISAGYFPIRCDEIFNSKSIPANMFEHLDNDPVVLCDLSTYNPNVLYELGRRHYQKKITILVMEEGQEYIFDLQAQGCSVITYRKLCYYREVLEDQRNISAAILNATQPQNEAADVPSMQNISEFRSLRMEHYKEWPIKKTAILSK